MAKTTRYSELVAFLERSGVSVSDALNEAVFRSMNVSPLYEALEAVCYDVRDGTWPNGSESAEIVGESWERCASCRDDFLPEEPGYTQCRECNYWDGVAANNEDF